MVSEANSVPTSLVPNVQAAAIAPASRIQGGSGNNLPASGNSTSASAAKSAEPTQQKVDASDPQSIVTFLNKYLNDSGLPDQFRIDPSSSGKFIQEINPASGEVVAEYAIAEFPALARGIGASGLLIDGLA
jgi:hypothetical protein